MNKPVAVRYAWATSPMGNLKVNGKEWLPLASFCTDTRDWPESDDPDSILIDRAQDRALNKDAAERNTFRRSEEAKLAGDILKRLKTLGR